MKNTFKKVVILGAGWLGKELMSILHENGVFTQATIRSEQEAQKQKLQFYYVNENLELKHNIDLQDAYWVSCITPKSNYVASLEHALKLANKLKMKGFLLCSSTGIYPSEMKVFDEKSIISHVTNKQKLLEQAEQLVLRLGDKGKVVRLAGLMGRNRHPGQFVAGKRLNASALASVNMLHQKDAIYGIIYLLNHWQHADNIYNLTAPDHPSKQKFYSQACQLLNNMEPSFSHYEVENRIIDGNKITQLGYRYYYPSLATALLNC
ncbi:hypothetical protein [Pseudoalteromonas denitrificans]|uniref:Nucleoside-diphosphate-sugar epimerase n=1 Tax=Pseudoalteromonas denitrificans DSM 6059 TaxID=1123010 RepID=A0A1I1PNH4_9GAMM|nr:hypothetical protein [Pseudoalteromonas denitrificans]SFD08533.1 Nucleoside-diphosphate-sugar epimerase [Pseudoalteromonas denitrificans DSM 6059]